MSRERYDKSTLEKIASGFWILFIFLLVFWFVLYLLSPEIRFWSNFFFSWIFKDWQLTIAFFTLMFITIGWTMIEGLFKLIFYMRVAYNDKFFIVTKAIRFLLITYFIMLIFFRYVTIWDFDNWELYIFSLALLGVSSFIFFKSRFFNQQIIKMRKSISSKDFKYIYIPIEKVILSAVLAGAFFIYLFFYFVEKTPWVVEFTDMLLTQLLVNPVIITLAICMVIFIFFTPLLQIVIDLLPSFTIKILSDQMKDRIRSIKIWTLVFMVITLVIKSLPFWNLPDYVEVILSFVLLLVSWLVSRKSNLVMLKGK